MRNATNILAAFALGGALLAQDDGFQREPAHRESKDPLEGKAPPALQVTGWLNTGGEALRLARTCMEKSSSSTSGGCGEDPVEVPCRT